jgi:hypothetical protein
MEKVIWNSASLGKKKNKNASENENRIEIVMVHNMGNDSGHIQAHLSAYPAFPLASSYSVQQIQQQSLAQEESVYPCDILLLLHLQD